MQCWRCWPWENRSRRRHETFTHHHNPGDPGRVLALPAGADTIANTSQNGLIVLSGLDTDWTYGKAVALYGYGAEFAKAAGWAQIRLGSTAGPTLPMLWSPDGTSQVHYLPAAVRWIPAYSAADNSLQAGSKVYIFYRPGP